jgi:hypothetical protein
VGKTPGASQADTYLFTGYCADFRRVNVRVCERA